MYHKYNLVLRAKSQNVAMQELKKKWCGDNDYVSTIHAINSCVVKMTKLMEPCKVFAPHKPTHTPMHAGFTQDPHMIHTNTHTCTTPSRAMIQVWRGSTKVKLPESFYMLDKHGGGRGGVEYGFTSTSKAREQALKYADGKASTVFYMKQGIVDRGADISWLSQFPEEEEYAGWDRTVPPPTIVARRRPALAQRHGC